MHAVTAGVDGHCSPLLALATDVSDNGVTPPESRRTNPAGGFGWHTTGCDDPTPWLWIGTARVSQLADVVGDIRDVQNWGRVC